MRKYFSLLIIGIILFLCGFIYFYRLNSIPNGFYVDEATVAYNAYSILNTGKDIFAQPYPILFRLLGSYTPGLFIYVSAVFIKFFGNSPYVFRSISAISALVSIIFFYKLADDLKVFKSQFALYITTLFYGISPWMIFNARLGYETTLAYLLFNIGVYFFFLAFKNSRFLIWGAVFTSFSTYTAHTQRYLLPVFLFFYFLIFRKTLLRKDINKDIKKFILVLFILMIPNIVMSITPAFWVKNQRLFGHSFTNTILGVVNQTLTYLSPKNIFFQLNDIDMQHTIPEMSVMYDWMVIPFFIGIYFLFDSLRKFSYKFIAFLFVVSLVPAAFSGQFISIQRALPFLLPLVLMIGLGIDYLWKKMGNLPALFVFSLLFIYSIIFLYRSYFVLFPRERADAWDYGYAQLTYFIKNHPNVHFMIDNSRNPRNYILILYYLHYPPALYQDEVNVKFKNGYYNSLPPEGSYKFSNIEVRPIDWSVDPKINEIIIGDDLSVSTTQARDHGLIKIYEFRDPNDHIIFEGFKTSVN